LSDVADWKEMLNWGADVPAHHPLRTTYPHRNHDQVLPDDRAVPGLAKALRELHDRVLDLQARFLRIVALGLGADERYFDDLLVDGSNLTRAIHYPPMTDCAQRRARVGRRATPTSTSSQRCRAPPSAVCSCSRRTVWADVVAARRLRDRQLGDDARAALERTHPRGHAPGDRGRRPGRRPHLGRAVLPPRAVVPARADPQLRRREHPLRYGTIEAGALLDRVLYEIGLIPPPLDRKFQ